RGGLADDLEAGSDVAAVDVLDHRRRNGEQMPQARPEHCFVVRNHHENPPAAGRGSNCRRHVLNMPSSSAITTRTGRTLRAATFIYPRGAGDERRTAPARSACDTPPHLT